MSFLRWIRDRAAARMVVDAIIGLVELFEYNSLFARQICRVESATKRQAYDPGLRRDNGAHSTGGDRQQPK
jgi:hypothetical protein